MKFLFPQFLWALSLIVIPIIIHLFNFRRYKKVVFSNIEMLQTAAIEEQGKRNLRKLLVLLSRIFALSFLVLAFAKPYFPGKNKRLAKQGNVICIYVDNSFSMKNSGNEGELLNASKNKATTLIKNYNETDVFFVINNDFEAKGQRELNKEAALQAVDNVTVSAVSRDLESVYNRISENFERREYDQKNKLAFWLSDFQQQKNAVNINPTDSSIQWYLLPQSSNEPTNISIDTAYFASPYVQSGKTATLKVIISNHGAEDIENVSLYLNLNESQKGLTNANIKAGSQTSVELNFTPDDNLWQRGSLKISDNPITFDDELFVAFPLVTQLNICEISSQSQTFIQKVFEGDDFFVYSRLNPNQIDYSLLKQADLVVINELNDAGQGLITILQDYLANGGSLMLFPFGESNPKIYNTLAEYLGIAPLSPEITQSKKVAFVNAEHILYKNAIDKIKDNEVLPMIDSYYPLDERSIRFDKLIALSNNQDVFRLYLKNSGYIYQWATSMQKQNKLLALNFIFPISALNAALQSKPLPNLFHVAASNDLIPLRNASDSKERIFEVSDQQNNKWIPEIVSSDGQQKMNVSFLSLAGLFALKQKNNDAVLAHFALNFNRNESVMKFYDKDTLLKIFRDAGNVSILNTETNTIANTINQTDSGKQLWRVFLALALLFLLIEILLLRFIK
jgi:hypothetical protein